MSKPIKYILWQSHGGNYYVIPTKKFESFENWYWTNLSENVEEHTDWPEYAEWVGECSDNVQFENPIFDVKVIDD